MLGLFHWSIFQSDFFQGAKLFLWETKIFATFHSEVLPSPPFAFVQENIVALKTASDPLSSSSQVLEIRKCTQSSLSLFLSFSLSLSLSLILFWSLSLSLFIALSFYTTSMRLSLTLSFIPSLMFSFSRRALKLALLSLSNSVPISLVL